MEILLPPEIFATDLWVSHSCFTAGRRLSLTALMFLGFAAAYLRSKGFQWGTHFAKKWSCELVRIERRRALSCTTVLDCGQKMLQLFGKHKELLFSFI